MTNQFSNILLKWYDQNLRELPWRKTKDPYFVWLSEIILQQTRIEQGLPYYEQFVRFFPKIEDLANASEEKVLNVWQGLGYYSRARNLLHTAKYITNSLDGKFPNNYKDLLKLKGIGPYTAAAIASFCFNEKKAVVDGNVIRFLSRYLGINEPVDQRSGKQGIENSANSLINDFRPGDFNQAIMEIGATVCKAKRAACEVCPFNNSCYAFQNDKVYDLPFKVKKTKVKKRELNYLVCAHSNKVLFKKRTKKDIWQGLYDFPEKATENDYDETLGKENYTLIGEPSTYYHTLSHQKLKANFQEIEIIDPDILTIKGEWIEKNSYESIPLPRLIEKYILDKH